MAMQGVVATEMTRVSSSLVSKHCEFVLRSRGASIKEYVPCDAACHICVAKTAALNRIKAAGGDVVKALEDPALRAVDETCVVRALPLDKVLPSWRDRIVKTDDDDGEGDPAVGAGGEKVIRVAWEPPPGMEKRTIMVKMKMEREVPPAAMEEGEPKQPAGVVKNTWKVPQD